MRGLFTAALALGATCISGVAAGGKVTDRLLAHPKNEANFRVREMKEKMMMQEEERKMAAMQKRGEEPAFRYLNKNSAKYAVNGTGIPEVDWDIGESYSGLMPISTAANETQELFFWFFPSNNSAADDEIMIWLNGGPGCSSLEGFLQENGPIWWQSGTLKPVQNPWSWNRLTNMVWVEQPIGTGFTQGKPTATSEADVAEQFMGFWKNFMDTFELTNRKVYISGESYAGMYVPYISGAMLDAEDKEYFDVNGIYVIDPVLGDGALSGEVPMAAFADYWSHMLNLNQSTMDYLHDLSDACGYTQYMEEQLVFPPTGPFPAANESFSCDLWDAIYEAAVYINPCFDIYDVSITCPIPWDVIGFPGSFEYTPEGGFIYFNRADVKAAIHAPDKKWSECSNINVFPDGDNSDPPAWGVLPSVIDRTNNTIIGTGLLDMILPTNGTLLVIQNMTWNGVQGLQSAPQQDFYVPYHDDFSVPSLAAEGIVGRTATERGLTYIEIALAGHMQPQYAPSAAFRAVELLLGRIDDLTDTSGTFTIPE